MAQTEKEIETMFRIKMRDCLDEINSLEGEKFNITDKFAGKTYLTQMQIDIDSKIQECKQKLVDMITTYGSRYSITGNILTKLQLQNNGIP